MARIKLQECTRITANKRKRKLDYCHPKYDAECRLGHRQLFGSNHGNGVAECRSNTRIAAGLKFAMPGRRITKTPIRPSTTTPARLKVMRSCKNHTASSAVHAGMVNSSANTMASGSIVRLSAHENCDA